MSEVVRDLVVSLSLDAGEFQRNMRAINASIKEAESTFKLAGAGVDKFGSSLGGQQAKLSYLRQMQTLQNAAVQQYAVKLQEANAKMQATEGYLAKYSARLAEARSQMAPLEAQLNAQGAAVRQASAAYSLADTAYQQNAASIASLQSSLSALEAEMVSTESLYMKNAELFGADSAQAEEYRTKLERLTDQYGKQKTQLAEMQAKGESLARTRDKWSQVAQKEIDKETQLKQKKAELEAEITKLEGQVKEETQALENNRTTVVKAQADLNNARAKLRETDAQIKTTEREVARLSSAWTQAGTAMESFSKKCTEIGGTMQRMGRTMSRYLTTPVTGLATTSVKAAMDYEQAFANVRRTVNATEEELAEFSDQIEQMSTVTATSAENIAEVVATAGQLGIHTENIMDFSRAMIDLGMASTDLEANTAATELAKFANITGMSHDQFTNLSSTIVALGVNYATTESEIVEMGKRLAAAGTQVGLSEAQIMGFAAALSSVGLEAQAGGSAFSKALVKMEVAAQTGGDSLKDFARVCGVSETQFKQMWKSDPAAMFQRFIVGLSQMDEEGIGAIATLQEIGISEIRLRDTLLRATNANELFADSQRMAVRAWNENTMLTSSAATKYNTVSSQLANLKNKAMVAARQIGKDLTPTFQKLMDKANGLIASFMDLDASQRNNIIRWAGIAAAMGPVIMICGTLIKNLGVMTGVVGKVFKSFGKFSAAIKTAGGGLKGLGSVLVHSKTFWFALTAAVVAGTVALIDYASGAKATRETLKGLEKTAEDWKNTAAETFYGTSQGLSYFGMSADDFSHEGQASIRAAQEWLNSLLSVWSDGKRETRQNVNSIIESWKSLTDNTRTELQAMKTIADKNGYTDLSKQMQADLKLLDSMDKEIARLLKKKQNRKLSGREQTRLEELVNTRNALVIKYRLVPENEENAGFDAIRKKVEGEVARAAARGQKVPVTVYENAVVAAGEGMAAINARLDEQYDSEYAVISLIKDEEQRLAAIADLNERYNADRRAAALEYAALLKDAIPPVWQKSDIQEAKGQVVDLIGFLNRYSASTDKNSMLPELNTLTQGMDEAAMAEYVGMLVQIQSLLDSGMSEDEVQAMFPDIDFSTQLEHLAAIQEYLNSHPWDTNLDSLRSMFGDSLGEEVLRIATDLDMTGAMTRWEEWADHPGAITTDAVIDGYTEAENAVKQQPVVEAFVAKYTERPEGADKTTLTPTGILAYVTTYAEVTTGTDVSGLTPTNITAMVAAYEELASGTDTSQLTPADITAYVLQYLEAKGVDTTNLSPDAVTAFVVAYEELTGGASTTALTPSNITAMVVKYMEAEGVDLTALSPDQITGIVNAFAEATGCDKTQLLQELVGYITEYREAAGVKRPDPTFTVGLSGYDLTAYRNWLRQHPGAMEGIMRLSQVYSDPSNVLGDTGIKYWKNGVEIPVSTVTENMLNPEDLVVLDKDGTLHVIITTEVKGTAEAAQEMHDELEKESTTEVKLGFRQIFIASGNLMDRVRETTRRVNQSAGEMNGFGGMIFGRDGYLTAMNQTADRQLNNEYLAMLGDYLTEMMTTLANGEQLSEDNQRDLLDILGMLNILKEYAVGDRILTSLAESMSSAGFEATVDNVVDLVRQAAAGMITENPLQVGLEVSGVEVTLPEDLPETVTFGDYEVEAEEPVLVDVTMVPVSDGLDDGAVDELYDSVYQDLDDYAPMLTDTFYIQIPSSSVLDGVSDGMKDYDFTSAGKTAAQNAKNAVAENLGVTALKPAGFDTMRGLAGGILSGQSLVVQAMRRATRAAVKAAKDDLKIASPSRVFRDEIGVMTMKGLGEGVVQEAKDQARIMRNAARYLTGEAKEGSVGYPARTDNSRIYNSNSSVNLSGNSFYIRDQQDIRSLAVEIATLTKRQQRGRGLRMA